MNWNIDTYIRKLESDGFFGTVSITLKSGQIVLAETRQALKPIDIQQIITSSGSESRSQHERHNEQQR